jgi:plastocyanin
LAGAPGSRKTWPAAAVSITRGEFDPIAVTVQAGQEVIWRNNPVSVQSVTAVAFRSGTIAPGATFTSTFTVPGTYRYTAAAGTSVGTVIVVP